MATRLVDADERAAEGERMIWAVYCIDVPQSRPIRDAFRKDHRAYLDTYMARIFFSGPLWDDDAFDQAGSLFLIDLPSRAEAEQFIEQEPYRRAGVFASVSIRRMTRGRFNPELSGETRERPDLPETPY